MAIYNIESTEDLQSAFRDMARRMKIQRQMREIQRPQSTAWHQQAIGYEGYEAVERCPSGFRYPVAVVRSVEAQPR